MSGTSDRPLFEPLPDPDMDEMKKVAAGQGKAGDLKAIELSSRLRERGRGPIGLPPINDLASLKSVQGQLIGLFDADRLSDRKALTYAKLIEYRRRVIRAVDIEARIRAIEERQENDLPPVMPQRIKR